MIVILNFKTYPESTGADALLCAEAAYKFSRNKKHKVIVCPQYIDIESIIAKYTQDEYFEVWAQHIDFGNGAQQTGYVPLDSLKKIGIKGSLLNHAEHKIADVGKYSQIDDQIPLCLCVSDTFELALDLNRNPDFTPKFVAYEPPGLIGGNISVSKSKPEVIENIVDKFSKYPILVGAGIKSNEDVQIAQKLGAKGILIASGFVLAVNKETFLEELLANIQ